MSFTTAAAITLGSVALVGALYGSKAIESAPPEEPAPEVPPTSVPAEEPAPSVPAEEPAPSLPVQAGGGIGRPPWGVVSTNVPTGELPPGIATAIASISGTLDPRNLREQIVIVTRQLDTARFNVYQADESIKKINEKYVEERKKYIEKYSLSKNADTISKVYEKRLSTQGQQKGKNDPDVRAKQAEIDKASGDEKKKLEKEKQEMLQAKPVDDKILDEWTKKYSDALGQKIAADDDRDDAEREKNKYQAQITELRTKKDGEEKMVKELNIKLQALLALLQKQLGINKSVQKAADWDARTKRYAIAVRNFNAAESKLRIFVSETWLPLATEPTIQATYRDQYNTLKALYDNAKAQLDLARTALTASAVKPISTAMNEFAIFVADVEEITKNAVDRSGNIKPEFRHTPGITTGYPEAVKKLKDTAKIQKLATAADTYYEIASKDLQNLILNSERYIDYFRNLLGTRRTGLVTVASERTQSLFSSETTRKVLKDFVDGILGHAANSERLLPQQGPMNAQTKIYSDLRTVVNSFVDKQIYSIKKMFKTIKDAKKSLKPSDLAYKNLLELQSQAEILFPLRADVPPDGQCKKLFYQKTFEYFQSGFFEKKDILKDVLTNPEEKQKFLDAIGFIKVNNLLDAQAYSKTSLSQQRTSYELIVKSAFKEYVDKIDIKAYNYPDVSEHYVNQARDIWEGLNAPLQSGAIDNAVLNRYKTATVDQIIIPERPRGRPLITNRDFARQLHVYSDGSAKFNPGVFLPSRNRETGRDGPIVSIKEFKNACELDGNVGHGQAESDRILEILTQLENIEPVPKATADPLLKLIENMEKRRTILLDRGDQSRAISTLKIRGFPEFDGFVIKKVEDKKDINFVQTFLTFRSSKFRSIQYNDATEYNGKTWNSRELYASLFIDHLFKMPSFETRKRETFPEDSDWLRVSTDFNLNFIIFKEGAVRGEFDYSAAHRTDALVFHVFKSISGRYYPILIQEHEPAIPGILDGRSAADTDIDRGIFGGAIDGVEFPVTPEPAPVESTAAFVGRKLAAAPAAIARVAYKTIVRPWKTSDVSCITNRGKRSFYANVTEGVRQEKCVIKLGELLLQLCKDSDETKSNNLGRGGFKDAFCAIVEKDFGKLKKGTTVALLYYRKSGEEPDIPVGNSDYTVYIEQPHKTADEFLNEVGPSLDRQDEAAELNIAPKIYSLGFVPGVGGFAVVEFITGQSLADILKSNSLTEEHLLDLLKSFLVLGNKNITQRDINTANFVLERGKFVFIDDLSPVYKPGRKPESVQDHFLKSVNTLMMIVNSGHTLLEGDFSGFVNKILSYNIVGAVSFRAEYISDSTATKTSFHKKIVDIFAEAIPDAKKIESKPARPVERAQPGLVDERGLPIAPIPRPPPIPAVEPGLAPPPPPPPLPEAPHEDAVEVNREAIKSLFSKGGRRRTISWRRSKPARYTRRKF